MAKVLPGSSELSVNSKFKGRKRPVLSLPNSPPPLPFDQKKVKAKIQRKAKYDPWPVGSMDMHQGSGNIMEEGAARL